MGQRGSEKESEGGSRVLWPGLSENASAESSTPKERLELRSGFGAPVAKEKYISILVGRCLHRCIVERKFAYKMDGHLISLSDLNVSKE